MKKNIKLFAILAILLCIYVFINALFYTNKVSSDLSTNIFRLHVIANSNSQTDQNLKLKVRDSLINYMSGVCCKTNSKQETINYILTHFNELEHIVNTTISDNGFNYNSNLEIGNYYFPTKTYGDISLPSGNYDALEVKIGKSEGKNWWCVLYPSLCFVDINYGIVPDESKSILKNSLTDEEYILISDSEKPTINFKFKLVEFFNNNNIFVANKN